MGHLQIIITYLQCSVPPGLSSTAAGIHKESYKLLGALDYLKRSDRLAAFDFMTFSRQPRSATTWQPWIMKFRVEGVVTVVSSRGGLKLNVSTSKSPKGSSVEVTHPIPLQNHVHVFIEARGWF